MVDGQPPAAISIDVEDWFHVGNLRRAIPRESWRTRELRVEKTMDRMLAHMAERNVRSTCFVLGWVALRLPDLVRRIADGGHEIASHGYGHEPVRESTPAAFRADVKRSKRILEDITGQPVLGYRAPSFSIADWALPILQEVGFEYDSSHFPTSLPQKSYGKLSAARANGADAVPAATITEVPLPCLSLAGLELPWAGGGYFRLIPYPVFRIGVRRILRSGRPYVFYIHPWELDATQPRVTGLKRGERMRHYLNLEVTESRWTALLDGFAWMRVCDLVAQQRDWAGLGERVLAEARQTAEREKGRVDGYVGEPVG